MQKATFSRAKSLKAGEGENVSCIEAICFSEYYFEAILGAVQVINLMFWLNC